MPALLDCDRGDPRPDYVAWWFFAFGLADMQRWPFPFFVRGDDIFFGLHNDFEIITTLGIACLRVGRATVAGEAARAVLKDKGMETP